MLKDSVFTQSECLLTENEKLNIIDLLSAEIINRNACVCVSCVKACRENGRISHSKVPYLLLDHFVEKLERQVAPEIF